MKLNSNDIWAALNTKWTGKSVKVNSAQPDFARFADKNGIVITVNRNGRCLVDFHDGGWYDFEPETLVICDVMQHSNQQAVPAGSTVPVRQK